MTARRGRLQHPRNPAPPLLKMAARERRGRTAAEAVSRGDGGSRRRMRPGGGADRRLHGARRRSAADAVRPRRAGGAGGGLDGGVGPALPAP